MYLSPVVDRVPGDPRKNSLIQSTIRHFLTDLSSLSEFLGPAS